MPLINPTGFQPADYYTLLALLASNAHTQGASLVGVEDAAGHFTGLTVEDVLAELYTDIGTSVGTVTKTSIGLGNVDNTSDVNKPVSTSQQTALNLKANLNAPALVNPTVGTQSPLDNSTKAASTAYTDAAVAAGKALATPQVSTAGTSIDFTGLPSGVKRITINFVGVSTSGTSNPLIQLGDSGGIETSGYLGVGAQAANAAAVTVTNYTTGFGIPYSAAANVMHGSVILTLENSSTNTWAANGQLALSNAAVEGWVTGSKSTSAVLDRVRITTVGGTDTFDAGEINILYE